MAVTYIQSAFTNIPSDNVTQIVTINGVTSGNLLIVGFAGYDDVSFPDIVSISDGVNTYSHVANTQVQTDLDTNGGADIWYANNVTGGNLTLTVTYSPTALEGYLGVSEFAGAASVSPMYGGNTINEGAPAVFVGPDLTPVNAADMLVSFGFIGSGHIDATGGWTSFAGAASLNWGGGYYAPGATGTFHMTIVSPATGVFFSTGAIISSASTTMTLNLSDSISLNDSSTDSFGETLTDSLSVSDSAPNAFSAQSNFIAAAPIPVVEQLVNQLVPANVKTYFIIEE